MKTPILETKRAPLVMPRFLVLLALLRGKHDIDTGRPCFDICADTPLSPGSVRRFLSRLRDLDLVEVSYIPPGHIPTGLGWPGHNEYTLKPSALAWIEEQIAAWEATGLHSADLVGDLRAALEKMRSAAAGATG